MNTKQIVWAAIGACKSFARSSQNFFDFKVRQGYCGWENWLTVDIVRRLNDVDVIPFCPIVHFQPQSASRLDIGSLKPAPLAVEIKVNYLTNSEIDQSEPSRLLPDRVWEDARKLAMLGNNVGKLLLVATCFESRDGLRSYRELVKDDVTGRFRRLLPNHKWYDCATKGRILLLALSTEALPNR